MNRMDRGFSKEMSHLREQFGKKARKAFDRRLLAEAVKRHERAMEKKERLARDVAAALHPLTGEIM